MTITTGKIEMNQELIVDDISNQIVVENMPNEDKMAVLKARLAAKEAAEKKAREMIETKEEKKEEKMTAPVVKKEKSINFGIVGSGQAGNRIAQEFYSRGYDCVAINTAQQDLKFIEIPESNKLLLENGLSGCAKELELGHQAAFSHKDKITDLVNTQLADAQVLILTMSLGGGSGAGSCEVLVDILAATGKPLVVITVLPAESDDSATKSNALKTISKLAKFTKDKRINNLIVVDNAKIENIYKDVGQMSFFGMANKAIVDTIDAFNTLSAMPSAVKSLDGMEFAKLFIDGEGLTVYGDMTVSNFEEDTAIAEAIINNLDGNLLASGFDLKQSKYVGVIIAANKATWDKIPSSSVNYAMAMVNDSCGSPLGVFRGLYQIDIPENVIKIYSMFSGLHLPISRLEQLKKDAAHAQTITKSKDGNRNAGLSLDTGTNDTVSAAQQIKNKIAAKGSAFGKLAGSTIIDRRK